MPIVIVGGCHADARGTLRFCNGFDMSEVKRFYTIANSAAAPVRGWFGHRRETKWFFPLKGTTEIVVEPMDLVANGKTNGRDSFLLDSDNPCVLRVGPGNWFYIEQHGGAEVMVFSDCKVGEYENDDLRRKL